MAPKRQADSNNTAPSQYCPPTTRSRRQAESTKKKTATFETGAVIICLGSQTVRVDMKELRDRSGYFARFPENAFPKRFVLTPGDHVESICSLLLHPESVIGLHENTVHNNNEFKQAYDIQTTVLGLICPSCHEIPAIIRSKEPDFLLNIGHAIHIYQCTEDVRKLFVSKFRIDPSKEDPYLVLQIAKIIQDEDLYSRTIPNTVNLWLNDSMPATLPGYIRTLVQAEAKALKKLLDIAGEGIEKILSEPDDICGVVAAHCIRQFYTNNSPGSIARPAANGSWKTLQTLYKASRNSSHIPLIVGEDQAMQQIEILDYVHIGLCEAESGNHERIYTEIDLRPSSVRIAVADLLGALEHPLGYLFKEDQDVGYFTPVFHGRFPWKEDVAPDMGNSSDTDGGATEWDEDKGNDVASDTESAL